MVEPSHGQACAARKIREAMRNDGSGGDGSSGDTLGRIVTNEDDRRGGG